MATTKQKILLPAILLANDLLDGDVVFWTERGWSIDPAEALVARDETAAVRLQEVAAAALARGAVVDAYLVDVALREDGLPVPNHFRERFKIAGPSIRQDLGKQAAFAHLRGRA
ncbi:DUF2849 domain-containing protein [Phreatobacter sp.]|uniref:DUF2849 domain-containing protein n=1 Tax=Phreatobacter sp. TaxID=1966341 RepID=UPI0025EAD26C|nr:DUF2849 domain-containing protein [Phreatobacter sp.]